MIGEESELLSSKPLGSRIRVINLDKSMMNIPQRRRSRLLLDIVGFLVILNLCSLCLIGVSPLRILLQDYIAKDMANDLANAKRTWQVVAVDSYEIDIRFGAGTMSAICMGDSELHTLLVLEGEVVAANGEKSWPFYCYYESMTVVSMFDEATRAVESYDPINESVRIKYDPEWGYVVEFESDIPIGWFQPSFGGSRYFVIVDDFRPLE